VCAAVEEKIHSLGAMQIAESSVVCFCPAPTLKKTKVGRCQPMREEEDASLQPTNEPRKHANGTQEGSVGEEETVVAVAWAWKDVQNGQQGGAKVLVGFGEEGNEMLCFLLSFAPEGGNDKSDQSCIFIHMQEHLHLSSSPFFLLHRPLLTALFLLFIF
jgi:hypothetical protein